MNKHLFILIISLKNLAELFIFICCLKGVLIKKKRNCILKGTIITIDIILTILIGMFMHKIIYIKIILLVMHFIMACLLFEVKINKKLRNFIICLIFYFVGNLLFLNLLTSKMEKLTTNISNSSFVFYKEFISKLTLILIFECMIQVKNRNLSRITFKFFGMVAIVCIFSIICANLFLENTINDTYQNNIFVMVCVIILYINIIILYMYNIILYQINENNLLKQKETIIHMQKEQYESATIVYNQIRKTQHDILGHFTTLEAYLVQNYKEEAINYIHKLNEKINFKVKGIFSNNIIVDAQLKSKKLWMDEHDIAFREDIIIPRKLKVDDIDLSIILSNILDNAVEGCLRIKEQEKQINLKIKYKHDNLIFELVNTYNPDTIKKSNEKYVSSKLFHRKNESGIGLENVKEIVEQYNGIMQIELVENLFITKILLPNIEKNNIL